MVNPYEIQKLINTKYKVENDEIINLNTLMIKMEKLLKSYDNDIIGKNATELKKYQTEYDFNLYSLKYNTLIIQKNVSDKSYHNKRLGFFRDMIIAKDSGNIEDYQTLFSCGMDILLEEAVTESKLSLTLARTIPLLHNSSIEYFIDLYKKIKLENLKLSMVPELKVIKENYDVELKKITDKVNMLNSKDIGGGEILELEKEKLDIKLAGSMNTANEKLSKLQQQSNNYKKSDMNIYKIREMIKELSIFFDKKETTLSSESLNKFVNLEKQFNDIKIYLTDITDREIDLSKRKVEETKETMNRQSKYYDFSESKIKEQNYLMLKSICYTSLRRGEFTVDNFIEESATKILDDILDKYNLNQTKENGKRIS